MLPLIKQNNNFKREILKQNNKQINKPITWVCASSMIFVNYNYISIIHILLILIITAVVDNFKTTTTGCPTGYTGHDCKKPCRYPSFGIDCQLRCCCAQNRCNHMFGCNTSYINGKRKFLALFLSNLQWK